MNILDQIVAAKYCETEERKLLVPVRILEKSIYFYEPVRSLKEHICATGSSGIIAEFKRRSPSAGIINEEASPQKMAIEYENAGCSAISVLTDNEFFGGSSEDLSEVRKSVKIPVLRKDFIVDEYQIIESRAIGADAILLIAEIHSVQRLYELFRFAVSVGLEVLIEVHDKASIDKIPHDAEIIGINSRDLTSFSVNSGEMATMVKLVPRNPVKVAESGIRSADNYIGLKKSGFNAFLIGEHFMRSPEPGEACRKFVEEIGLKRQM